MTTIKRALLSVSDKTGIVEFARGLERAGVEILSTGGTAHMLSDNGIRVTEVSAYTGFPEIMDGRVKTLHPKIHGGLLGRRGMDEAVMAECGIKPIDLLAVNLYPFEQTIAKENCTLADAVENIDIGGPAMLRAAAKNYRSVAVVVDTGDYDSVISEMQTNDGQLSDKHRFELAAKAFAHSAAYDAAIAGYLGAADENTALFPPLYAPRFRLVQQLRYGENPHQRAAFYRDIHVHSGCIASSRQLQGKALSYNNIADADAALECIKGFATPSCVIVKHANPCGVATATALLDSYERAYATDPTSAFGGIIAFNEELDGRTARAIIDRQFVEVIVAPEISTEAAAILAEKPNIRVMACGQWRPVEADSLDYKRVNGGLLVQERDLAHVREQDLKTVSQRKPTVDEIKDLLFAWRVARHVKSNAIVYAKEGRTIGIGAGQMSRVYSARIAAIKAADAGLEVRGSVMASDAFFPFRDSIDSAKEAGITAVIQPGGSIRDKEVIKAADEHGMAMVFTGIRHFRH